MKKILFFVTLCCLFAACRSNGVAQPKSLQLSSVDKELVNHCNDFSFSLLAQSVSSETQENIILSPLSASMLLGMVMNGADGETLVQMQSVLGFGGTYAIGDINAYYRQLIDVLPALDKYTCLNMANGIWVRKDFPVRDDFAQACKQYFDAQAKNVSDFYDEKVLNDINSFAAQHTAYRITKVIDASMIDDNTVMALLNALYFKALWADKFDKKDTRQQRFTTLDGKQIKTDMMHQETECLYVYGEDFQLVELPYKGDKYCADIVLPAKDTDIRAWLKKLNAEKWRQMLAKAYKTELSVALPKFSLNYNRTLNEDLQALGMKDAFGRQADFSRLSEIPAFISLIKQYTFLQVDEEGTEAAAVTIGLMDKNAASMGFVADRPFLFVIREREQGTILFTALVGHPEWQNN